MAELMSTLKVNENEYTIKDATARSRIDDLYAIKESLANKVTSIDSDSTDTEYPSAKCVYDAIQVNSGLFVEITYGSTSSADIDAILAAGKYPYLYYGSRLYIYTSSTTYYHMFNAFTEVGSVIWYGVNVLRSSSAYSQVIISQSNSIDSSSSNSQIPSAKAVYDFVTGYAVKLYRHNITITYAAEPGDAIYVSILSISNVAMDAEAFMTYATSQFDKLYKIQASGTFHDTTSVSGSPDGITVDSYPAAQGGTLVITGRTLAGQYLSRVMYRTVDNFVVTDTVVEVQ